MALAMAEQELTNHQKQMDNALEVDEFMGFYYQERFVP